VCFLFIGEGWVNSVLGVCVFSFFRGKKGPIKFRCGVSEFVIFKKKKDAGDKREWQTCILAVSTHILLLLYIQKDHIDGVLVTFLGSFQHIEL
jgi:hypothetical protein